MLFSWQWAHRNLLLFESKNSLKHFWGNHPQVRASSWRPSASQWRSNCWLWIGGCWEDGRRQNGCVIPPKVNQVFMRNCWLWLLPLSSEVRISQTMLTALLWERQQANRICVIFHLCETEIEAWPKMTNRDGTVYCFTQLSFLFQTNAIWTWWLTEQLKP